ncbi:MAG: DUF3352 domain-containing protein [Oscillatoria princeps RMCB-10]|jgi:hypothetical protein|nr:DUF3352 domain-containing protein [Oscillatoria princeps RMCB-10]
MFDSILDKTKSAFEKTKSAVEKIEAPQRRTAGAAALLIVGGVAIVWALIPKSQVENYPVGASVVPEDAWMAVSLSTDPGQWEKLQKQGTAESQKLLNRQLLELGERFLTPYGLDYQKDIQPWVGREVMVAWLPPQVGVTGGTSPSSGQPPVPKAKEPVVMVLPVDNQGRAKDLLEKPKPLPQGLWVSRTYKDVQIREMQGAPTENYSAALLDNRFLAVTTDPKATERVIDTYKAGQSIAKTPGYKEAVAQIEAPDCLARVYVNWPIAANMAAMNAVRLLPPQGKNQLQKFQGFAATVTQEAEGIRLQGISWLKADSEKKQVVENKAKSALSRLPAETLIVWSGSNLQRLWQDYALGARGNPFAPMSPELLQQGVASNTGLNWEKDLLAWMAGDFSLSLIPAVPGSSTQFPAGLVLMVQSNDRRSAEKSLLQLDKVISQRYKFKVEQVKVGGQPVVNWTSQYGGVTLSRGWVSGNVAFLTLGAPVAGAITPNPKAPLALSQSFQKAVPSELDASNSIFFIDVERTLNSKQFALPQLPPVPQTLLSAIRTIGLTSSISNERSTRYEVFVRPKQEGTPGASPSPTTQPQAKPSAAGSPAPSR